jgi:CRISPR-associated endonuclease/helicase Cas3
MSPELSADQFYRFFEEIHHHPPFPWQDQLLRQVAETCQWPDVLDLPTGSGKTAALDIAVFHLALEATRGARRRVPVRIALVVDRRLVVDHAFARAKKIVNALENAPKDSVTFRVAERLHALAGEGNPPLLARRLRGGVPREDDWARTPSQPTILCSTVDQVGSRLLFRGYGVTNSMKPVHAGLIGADCLILLDEAHLSEPFRQTLHWVKNYRGEGWRTTTDLPAPWVVVQMTATPGSGGGTILGLAEADYANETLNQRWEASKPARLIDISRFRSAEAEKPEGEKGRTNDEEKYRVAELVRATLEGITTLREAGIENPATAVVVNRVARAREVFEELCNSPVLDQAERVLMIGPARPVERDAQIEEKLALIRTGSEERKLVVPLVIVSTQCIEAGVDIDLDGLITESAPLDALRQRFGRLNRAGRDIRCYAAIVGGASADKKDSVYGEAIWHTWNYLIEHSDLPPNKKKKLEGIIDFGLDAFAEKMCRNQIPEQALSPKPDAPVLMPAHLDLLSQTAPIPNADPEVSLYLHGPLRSADAVTVVWRADVQPNVSENLNERTRRLLVLMPPRSSESIELPVWAVRRWLQDADVSDLADVPGSEPEGAREVHRYRKLVFRWSGDDEGSQWIGPADIRPGDTIVVPTHFGGVDRFGWNPNSTSSTDVADQAAFSYSSRRFAVRVAPGLLTTPSDENRLARAIAGAKSADWGELRDAVIAVGLPESITENLARLDLAKGKKGKKRVECYTDLYGEQDDCPRGVVFCAPFGIASEAASSGNKGGWSSATEDDLAGSLPGFSLSLVQHSVDVERTAQRFATLAGLPDDRIVDVTTAAYLHDAGKVDLRFQSWLASGDPLGPDPDDPEQVLAKSARPLPLAARAQWGLPEKWRHEAFSVRLAPFSPRFAEAKDPELVLWLIGTHHGYGRPLFPHADPADAQTRTDLPPLLGIPSTLFPDPGPQSLAYDWNGSDWPTLYGLLKARYGLWELARMEAILRLADHRASEQAARIGVA